MTGYDYNATYGPLRVYNQQSEGDCVYYAKALGIAAQVKMHTAVEPSWPDGTIPQFQQGGFQPDGTYIDYYVTLSDGRHVLRNPGSLAYDRDTLTGWLLTSGVVALGVVAIASFVNPPPSGGLPVIVPLASDSSGIGHACLAVGFTDKGIIVQNSYGPAWGYRGRAILSWEWLTAHSDTIERLQVDDYPLDGATRTPLPLKEFKMLLAQRTPASPVFAFIGGARTWIPSRTVLPTQGLSMGDVKVVDASDAIWTLPIVGNKPPLDN